MEPEEIDKLFKDRLTGLPARPSVDAWQRLQQKMEPTKKAPKLWIYYAAASIVIFLISGLLIMKLNSSDTDLASNTDHESKLPSIQNKAPLVVKENTEDKMAEKSLPKQDVAENNQLVKVAPEERIAQNRLASGSLKEIKQKKKFISSDKNSNKVTYLAVRKKAKDNTASDYDFKVNDNSSDNADTNSFTLADNPQSTTNTAVTASIVEITVKRNYPDESTNDENGLRENLAKKTLLLKNIYKQARNLKNGEPVELTALGVDKEKLQAETNEIKQKINKVISL